MDKWTATLGPWDCAWRRSTSLGGLEGAWDGGRGATNGFAFLAWQDIASVDWFRPRMTLNEGSTCRL